MALATWQALFSVLDLKDKVDARKFLLHFHIEMIPMKI